MARTPRAAIGQPSRAKTSTSVQKTWPTEGPAAAPSAGPARRRWRAAPARSPQPHQDAVDAATGETGGRPDQDAEQQRPDGCDRSNRQRDTRAVEQSRQHVPAQRIAAERRPGPPIRRRQEEPPANQRTVFSLPVSTKRRSSRLGEAERLDERRTHPVLLPETRQHRRRVLEAGELLHRRVRRDDRRAARSSIAPSRQAAGHAPSLTPGHPAGIDGGEQDVRDEHAPGEAGGAGGRAPGNQVGVAGEEGVAHQSPESRATS